jgi:glutamate:GABA antiporter
MLKNKRRVLSVFNLVMINIIAIDSLRSLPINAEYGLAIVFFYILGGLFFLMPCAFISAELATNWPITGGTYVWVREALGKRFGFANTWLQWTYNVVWYPTILTFLATSIAYLFAPALEQNKYYMIGAIIILFSLATAFNWFGMRLSSLISTLGAIFGTLLPMLIITILGIIWLCTGHHSMTPLHWKDALPNIYHFKNISFIIIIVYSLIGIEMSSVHAEEVKHPKKDYPKALLISSLIIIFTMIFSSLAIAVVIPYKDLSLVNGLNEAFGHFYQVFHIHWMISITEVMIVLGGFAGITTWIIGPTKSLLVAANDHCIPNFFSKANKHRAPVRILIVQWIVVLLLCSVFVLLPTVTSAYWLLSDMTAQIALVYYMSIFVSAVYLRYKFPKRDPDAYMVPGGNKVMWLLAIMGILACTVSITAGFFPPSDLKLTTPLTFEIILIVGVVIFIAMPFVIYQFFKGTK